MATKKATKKKAEVTEPIVLNPTIEEAKAEEEEKVEVVEAAPQAEAQAETTSEIPVEEPTRQKIPGCYVTLLATNDFMPGLIAMLRSYTRVRRGVPMIVMVTKEISAENRRIISFYGAQVLEIEDITLPDATNRKQYLNVHQHGAVHACMPKLNIFQLEGVEKVVYVDADMIFLQNTDELFQANNWAAVKDASASHNSFNAGLMVVEPNQETFSELIQTLYNNWYQKDYDLVADQDVFDKYFPDWITHTELHLDNRYNYQIFENWTFKSPDTLLSLPLTVKIVHFMGLSKPWITPSLSYFEYQGGYTYAALMEYYVELINGCIGELRDAGLSSKDLPLINLTMDHFVFGAPYPKRYRFAEAPAPKTEETKKEEEAPTEEATTEETKGE